MHFLRYARSKYLECLVRNESQLELAPLPAKLASKLFLDVPRGDKVASLQIDKNTCAFINAGRNTKHDCLEIEFGWYPKNLENCHELFPRRSAIKTDHSEALMDQAAFNFIELLDQQRNRLPNQSSGQYMWYPHAPLESQNGLLPIDYRAGDSPSCEDPSFKTNCTKVIEAMVEVSQELILPYLLFVRDKRKQ